MIFIRKPLLSHITIQTQIATVNPENPDLVLIEPAQIELVKERQAKNGDGNSQKDPPGIDSIRGKTRRLLSLSKEM